MKNILFASNRSLAGKRIEEALEETEQLIQVRDAAGAEAFISHALPNVNLVILDDDLSENGGQKALGQIRQWTEKIPVIMISESNNSEKVLKSFELGADDYIAFPISAALLKARIRAVMKRVYQDVNQEAK